MMNTIFQGLAVVACLLPRASSGQEGNGLIHLVSSFNAPVSCIAPSRGDDLVSWVGLENGNVIRVNFRTDEREVISTNFNGRVYDIIEEADTLWLGVRNQGLVKYSLAAGRVERAYRVALPGQDTSTSYAPYDLEMDGRGTLFAGTSSGVYRLGREGRRGDTLATLYRPAGHAPRHFGVDQVKILGDSLFCATEAGLVILAREGGRQQAAPVIRKKFSHLHVEGDRVLHASADSTRYEIGRDGALLDSARVPRGDLFAHAVDASERRGRWDFTATRVHYADSNGSLPPLVLPGRMSKEYRNYLHAGKDFMFFSRGMEVFLLALHQNTTGAARHVAAACTLDSRDTCYLISHDYYLYLLPRGGKIAPLGSLGKFESGENILQARPGDGRLWFITDRGRLYGVDLKPSTWRRMNPFRETYAAVADSLAGDFKSLLVDERRGLLAGTRYSLHVISDPGNRTGKRQTRTLDIHPPHDLYVTDICLDGEERRLLVSSLNHGLFEVVADSLVRRGGEEVGNIHQMLPVTNRRALLLASKGLFYVDKGLARSGLPTGERTKAISRLANGFYTGYRGVGTLSTGHDSIVGLGELTHLDIAFNKAAIADGLKEGTVLLGSPTGLYEYDGTTLRSIPIPGKPASVKAGVQAVAGAVVACWILLWGARRYRGMARRAAERESREEEELLLLVGHQNDLIREEIKKHEGFYEAGQLARIEGDASVRAALRVTGELVALVKVLLGKFAKYLPANELIEGMDLDLTDLVNAKTVEEIEGKSEAFFHKYRAYLGQCKEWSKRKKAVACIYLARAKTKPQDVAEILVNDIKNDTVSDIRSQIHSSIESFKDNNALLAKLYEKTKSNRE